MADIKEENVKNKNTGPPSVKFPMLTSSNYTVWSMRMKIALKVCEVWETIYPGSKDEKKNNMASVLISIHTRGTDFASWRHRYS